MAGTDSGDDDDDDDDDEQEGEKERCETGRVRDIIIIRMMRMKKMVILPQNPGNLK